MALSVTIKAWQRFQLNPTMTSVVYNDEDQQIVYPTVNVCPIYMIDESKITRFFGDLKNSSGGDEISDLVPNFKLEGSKKMNFGQFKNLSSLTNDLRLMLMSLSRECYDIFKKCHFKGVEINCCTFFLPTLSEKGLCFAFNTKIYASSQAE